MDTKDYKEVSLNFARLLKRMIDDNKELLEENSKLKKENEQLKKTVTYLYKKENSINN